MLTEGIYLDSNCSNQNRVSNNKHCKYHRVVLSFFGQTNQLTKCSVFGSPLYFSLTKNLSLLVLENFDGGAGKFEPENERGMVELVTHNQTPLADQPGQVKAVSGETHANSNGIFNTEKLCHCFLQLSVDCKCSNLKC